MPMISYTRMAKRHGSAEKESIIRIPMEQAVLYPAQSPPILQKDTPWKNPFIVAKEYISGALAAMLDLGKGSGPMDHGFAIKNSYTEEA